MNVKLLTKQHLEFLRLKGGCTGSSESKLVKMQHCWKSRVAAHTSNKKHQCWSCSFFSTILLYTFKLLYSSVHLILSALYYLLTDLSVLLYSVIYCSVLTSSALNCFTLYGSDIHIPALFSSTIFYLALLNYMYY